MRGRASMRRVTWSADPSRKVDNCETRTPSFAIATHPSLGEARRKALKEALLAAPESLFDGRSPAAGLVERPDSFYDSARRLVPAEPE